MTAAQRQLAAAEIVRRLPELNLESSLNAADTVAGIIEQHDQNNVPPGCRHPEAWPPTEARCRLMLVNAHRMLRTRYTRIELWAFVSDMTGHGSGYSIAICQRLGWDPHQPGSKGIA